MSTTSCHLPTATEPKKKTAIVNVRVFSVTTVGQPETVVIEGDKIVDPLNAVGAEEVDGDGGWLIPGLIDCCCNVDSESKMKTLTTYGITTALDMGESPSTVLREMKALAGKDGYPDFLSAGLVATLVTPSATQSPGVMLTLSTARQWVEERLREGSDFIRLISDHPLGFQPDAKVLTAAAAEAHQLGKFSIANGITRKGQQNAQDAKVHVIMNTPLDEALDERFVYTMAAEDRASIPTLVMMKLAVEGQSTSDQTSSRKKTVWDYPIARKSTSDHPSRSTQEGLDYAMGWGSDGGWYYSITRESTSDQTSSETKMKWDYSKATESVKLMHEANVYICAGTDYSTTNFALASPEIGSAMHEELQLLVEAGLTPADAIRAATSTAANVFNIRDRGEILPGRRADLVLLKKNPLVDIKNIRTIKQVWTAGVSWTPPQSQLEE